MFVYSVLCGLGPENNTHKLIVQDKLDNKIKPTVMSFLIYPDLSVTAMLRQTVNGS